MCSTSLYFHAGMRNLRLMLLSNLSLHQPSQKISLELQNAYKSLHYRDNFPGVSGRGGQEQIFRTPIINKMARVILFLQF